MSLQSGSICVFLRAQSVPSSMEVYALKQQIGVCAFQRVVLPSLVLQCALSHNCYAHSLCLCGAERCLGHPHTSACSLCLSRTKHPETRAGWLGDVQNWEGWVSAGALTETGERINSFKGLGYPDRLQGNLSFTEINLLTWERGGIKTMRY